MYYINCAIALISFCMTVQCKVQNMDKLYATLIWDKNYKGDPNEVKKQDITVFSKESDITRHTVPHQSNIQYGPRGEQRLDIYGDDLPQDAKIFVLIHGGSWKEGCKELVTLIAKPLHEAEIRVIIPNYDLEPKVRMTNIVSEIRKMADYVLTLAEGYNSKGVWFGGHSSGGHLASQLLTDDYLKTLSKNKLKLIKGFIFLSGTYDLLPRSLTSLNRVLKLTSKEIQMYSPLRRPKNFGIAKNVGMKVLLTIAQYDPPGHRKQGLEFRKFLINQGIDLKFIDLKNEDHVTEIEKLFYKNYNLTQEIISFINHD